MTADEQPATHVQHGPAMLCATQVLAAIQEDDLTRALYWLKETRIEINQLLRDKAPSERMSE